MESTFKGQVYWIRAHMVLNLVGSWMTLSYGGVWLWVVLNVLSFFVLIFRLYHTSRYMGIGRANAITSLRLIIVLGLLGWHTQLTPDFLLWLFSCAILLDGVDGFIARKYGESSILGEFFDGEVDALTVAVLSWIHVNSGHAPIWLMLPGTLRYFYGLVFFWIPVTNNPPKRIRATIAVCFFISLLLPFAESLPGTDILLIVSSTAIVISFLIQLVMGIRRILNTHD